MAVVRGQLYGLVGPDGAGKTSTIRMLSTVMTPTAGMARMAGFCPGGALPVIGTGRTEVLLFVAAMIAGIFTAQALMRLAQGKPGVSQTLRQ